MVTKRTGRKKATPKDNDTLREHYDLSKLEVYRIGSGWNGRAPVFDREQSLDESDASARDEVRDAVAE